MTYHDEGLQDWFRPLFEQSPTAIQIYAPDGRLMRFNQACLDLWGVTAAQVASYNILQDAQLVELGLMPYIQRGFAGEVIALPPARYNPRLEPSIRTGRPRWVQAFIYPVRDAQGALNAVVFSYDDITEQRVAEEQLREAYQLLEQRVAERTRELSILLEVSRNVASTLKLDPLLGLILDQLKTVVDYAAAAIFILERDDELRLLRYQGPIPQEKLHLRWPLDQAQHSREVIERRAPVIIPDVRADTPLAHAFQSKALADLQGIPDYIASWMAVPLIVRERVLGVLSFDHSEAGYYTQHHAALALAFANHAAVAIENARLYEQAQHLAALEERQKLARELHDSVSQALYGIALGARTARTLLDRDPARLAEPLDYVLSLAEAGMAEMRALIFELRPESLESEGLVAALQKQAAALRARHHIVVETELCPEPHLPFEIKEALYRIAQESLHNTVKHARASQVRLRLSCDGPEISLLVQDNGLGFDTGGTFPGHLGLRSMRERMARLNGTLSIESAPGTGTRVYARVPISVANS